MPAINVALCLPSIVPVRILQLDHAIRFLRVYGMTKVRADSKPHVIERCFKLTH